MRKKYTLKEMSDKLMDDKSWHPSLGSDERLVLKVMIDMGNKKGECSISDEDIAFMANLYINDKESYDSIVKTPLNKRNKASEEFKSNSCEKILRKILDEMKNHGAH